MDPTSLILGLPARYVLLTNQRLYCILKNKNKKCQTKHAFVIYRSDVVQFIKKKGLNPLASDQHLFRVFTTTQRTEVEPWTRIILKRGQNHNLMLVLQNSPGMNQLGAVG